MIKGDSMAVLGVDTGLVVAQFVIGVVDGEDSDDEPDIIPARGTFEFTPSTGYVPVPLGSPNPFTLMKDTIVGVLDGQGYLCTPHPLDNKMPGKRGLRLFATDTPNASVKNWTWNVTPKFVNASGGPIASYIAPFSIPVASGRVTDLTEVMKIPESAGVDSGVGLAQILGIAANAQSTSESALELAQQSMTIALRAAEDAADAGSGAGGSNIVVYETFGDAPALPAGTIILSRSGS